VSAADPDRHAAMAASLADAPGAADYLGALGRALALPGSRSAP
jgi:hypothetical protein